MSRWADWMSNPQYLAQVGHTLGGYSLILTAWAWSSMRHLGMIPVFATFLVGVVIASFKEFVYDTASWGEGDSWTDSLMDWGFYILGGTLGLIAALAFAYAA